jgi:imidazolonepropionase-like amidohydrolase
MMTIRSLTLPLISLLAAFHSHAQQAPAPASPAVLVKAGKLLDVRTGKYLDNAAIWIEHDRIKEAGPIAQVIAHAPHNAQVVDLTRLTILPGLIDCHTHLMSRADSGPDGYVVSLATKSQAFRALEGAADARLTLEAGFTSVRDVESEGSMYADVALRDAIQQGLVPGPRMQVATRAIAAVGQYFPFGVSPDLTNFPTGAQVVSGVEEARRAVREQIGHGADLIKVYADWRHPTLTVEEIRVVVEEAHKQGLKVAAHATTPQGIKNAVIAGVDSIEHGHGADREAIEMIKAKGIFLVPTVGVIDATVEKRMTEPLTPAQRQRIEDMLRGIQDGISLAMNLGVKMASGFDASEADLQGKNANELVSLVKRGLTPADTIRCATVNAAELMGWEDRVGAIEAGKYADLIAVEGDPLTDIAVLRHVAFVMKGGTVIKPLADAR